MEFWTRKETNLKRVVAGGDYYLRVGTWGHDHLPSRCASLRMEVDAGVAFNTKRGSGNREKNDGYHIGMKACVYGRASGLPARRWQLVEVPNVDVASINRGCCLGAASK